MSRGPSQARGGWVTAAAVVLMALGALLVGGLGGIQIRTYALRAPNQFPLRTLEPAQSVCEGPVTSPAPFRGVAIWGASIGPAARLTLTARDAGSGRVLASGPAVARSLEQEQTARLYGAVAGGMPVRVCVTDERGQFIIAGAPAVHPDIVMTGKPAGQEFSLLLLGGRRSLFSALPTAFSRAAHFRPRWVGTWTFWVLSAGLMAAFGFALVAVARAVAADALGAEEVQGAGSAPR